MFTSISRLLVTGLSMLFLIQGLLAGPTELSAPAPAFAAEQLQYSNVTLWVWPEYDDPRLLVMWEGKVAGTTGANTTVKFLVPTDAEMYFTGYEDASGNSTPVNPTKVPSDTRGYDTLSFDIKGDTFRVEYYQNSIQGNPDKTINFEYRTLYPIKNLNIDVQQPLLATNYKIEPALQSSLKIQNITSYQSSYDSLTSDEPLNLSIKYTKTDPATSIAPGSATGSTSTQSTNNNSQILSPSSNNTWIIVAAVAGLGGIIFFWLEKRRRDALAWDDDDDYDDYDDEDYEDDYYEEERPRKRRMVREPATLSARLKSRQPAATQTLERRRPQRRVTSTPRICPYCQAKVKGESSRCLACGAELNQ